MFDLKYHDEECDELDKHDIFTLPSELGNWESVTEIAHSVDTDVI